MKFNCILAFLFLSNANAGGNEKTVCTSVAEDLYEGQVTLIANDSSGFGPPTQGDVSIATLTPAGVSNFPSIMAICTLTAANPSDSPPFCTLETTLADGKIMATGTPPKLVVMGGTDAYYRASGMMTTGEDFQEANGSISFTARIDFCLPVDGGSNPNSDPNQNQNQNPKSECKDSEDWFTQSQKNGKEITCQKVKNKPNKHCSEGGADIACRKSCNNCD